MKVFKKNRSFGFIAALIFLSAFVIGIFYFSNNGHADPGENVGVLIIGLAEPQYMNEGVEGWKNYLSGYANGALAMVPGLNLDILSDPLFKATEILKGRTILRDVKHPFNIAFPWNRKLIDAWGNDYDGLIKYYVPTIPGLMRNIMFNIPLMGKWAEFGFDQAGDLPSLHVVPASVPRFASLGKGQPDIWEYMNLAFYPMYRAVDGVETAGPGNPQHPNELKVMNSVKDKIMAQYPWVKCVRFGFEAEREGIPGTKVVAKAMIEDYDLDKLVITEIMGVHSFMCAAAEPLKKSLNRTHEDVEIILAEPLGSSQPYANGVAELVKEEITGEGPYLPFDVTPIPEDEKVAVFLVHHGLCETDWKILNLSELEPYNISARKNFKACKGAVKKMFTEELGWSEDNFVIIQIYPEMSEGLLQDPFKNFTSVDEAMEEIVVPMGCRHIISVPYEVGFSAFETLWHYRHSWGIECIADHPELTERFVGEGPLELDRFRTELITDDNIHSVITDGWVPNWDDAMFGEVSHVLDHL